MSGTRKFGNWAGHGQMLKSACSKIDRVAQQSIGKAAVKLASFVKVNITDGGSTGGAKFLPLAESTKKRKKSTKPLLDNGDMRNSIKAVKQNNWSYFVGIPGTTKSPEGTSIADYATAHEFGAVIKTKSGATIIIPARPFFRPVIKKKKDALIKEVENDFKGIFK